MRDKGRGNPPLVNNKDNTMSDNINISTELIRDWRLDHEEDPPPPQDQDDQEQDDDGQDGDMPPEDPSGKGGEDDNAGEGQPGDGQPGQGKPGKGQPGDNQGDGDGESGTPAGDSNSNSNVRPNSEPTRPDRKPNSTPDTPANNTGQDASPDSSGESEDTDSKETESGTPEPIKQTSKQGSGGSGQGEQSSGEGQGKVEMATAPGSGQTFGFTQEEIDEQAAEDAKNAHLDWDDFDTEDEEKVDKGAGKFVPSKEFVIPEYSQNLEKVDDAFGLNIKPDERALAMQVQQMIAFLAQDQNAGIIEGDDYWDAYKLMTRKYNVRPLSGCKHSRERQSVILLLDTSPSCAAQSRMYANIAQYAVMHGEVEVYSCPNGRISGEWDVTKQTFTNENWYEGDSPYMRVVHEDDGYQTYGWNWDGRKIIYFGDWDAVLELCESSTRNDVYCFHHCLGRYESVISSTNRGYNDQNVLAYYNGQTKVKVTAAIASYYRMEQNKTEGSCLMADAPSLRDDDGNNYRWGSNVQRFIEEFGLEVVPKVYDKESFVTALRETLNRKTARL